MEVPFVVNDDDASQKYRLDFHFLKKIEEKHDRAGYVEKVGWVNRENWALNFCKCLPKDYGNHFATVAVNCVTVYRIDEATHDVTLVQAWKEEDEGEVLYSCAWSSTERDTPVLLVGGTRGMLKAIDVSVSPYYVTVMLGHGNAINEICVHPVHPELVFTASRDASIRLWNIRTAVCVAIFAGEKCHRDQVITCDVHPGGFVFASGGLDTMVNVWNLCEPRLKHAMDLSYTQPRRPGNLAFTTVSVQKPLYSTTIPHRNYVDCVRWVGDCLVSRDPSIASEKGPFNGPVKLWQVDNQRWEVRSSSLLFSPPSPPVSATSQPRASCCRAR